MLFVVLVVMMVSAAFGAEADMRDSVRYVLPEQTVTGTRIAKGWLENPTAISALTAEDQPANRGLGLQDNLMLVPGLVALSRFGTDDIRLAVRGMGARSNTGVRGVRVLYDGIPESEPDGQTRLEGIEVGNLDRVEVLRGAGGGLYGNAAGGVVNLRTSESFPITGVQADARGGSFGFSKLKLSMGTGGNRREGMTLTLSQTKTDGWREHSAYEGQIVSGSWRALATPQSMLRSVFYFTNVSALIPGPLNKLEYESDPDQAQPNYLDRNVLRYTRKGRLGMIYDRSFSDNFQFTFTPYGAVKKLDRGRENRRFQMISRYIVGGTLQGEWKGHFSPLIETEILGGTDQQLQDGPVTFYRTVHGVITDTLLEQSAERQWGQGYFLQWEVEHTQKWGLLVGGRVDQVDFAERTLDTPDPNRNYNEEALTPRLGFRYHLKPELVAFTSVYGGFETPTLSETENDLGYYVKPQRTVTAELGLREEVTLKTARLQAEGTLFRMNVTNAVVPDWGLDDGGDTVSFFSNAGKAVHQGIELSLRLSKRRLGFIGLAASFGDFRYTDYTTRTEETLDDKKVAGVSPDMVSGIARWEPRDEFFLELSVRNSGAAYADTRNTEKARGWTVLGAAVGGKLPVKAFSASWHVAVQNLTDEKFVSFIQVNDADRRYYESGMPVAVFGGISLGTRGL